MKLLFKPSILLLASTTAAALQIFPGASTDQTISRRSAVSKLIQTSTAAVAGVSSGSSSLFLPPVANAANAITEVTLNNNNKKKFPLASFGLQVYDDDTAYRLTLTALEVGYRNFFASVLADNQKGFAKVRYFLIRCRFSGLMSCQPS